MPPPTKSSMDTSTIRTIDSVVELNVPRDAADRANCLMS